MIEKLDCGHEPTPSSPISTGRSIDHDGFTRCYPCSDAAEAADMSKSDSYVAYVDMSGQNVTTWCGGHLARVLHCIPDGEKRHPFDCVDANGNRWYGRGARGMYVTIRRFKAK